MWFCWLTGKNFVYFAVSVTCNGQQGSRTNADRDKKKQQIQAELTYQQIFFFSYVEMVTINNFL